MTVRDRLAALEQREAIFARDGWLCQNCLKPIRSGQPQLAHRIPQTKAMIAKWGAEIIHHPDNMASACSLYCNAALDLRGWPREVAELAYSIAKKIGRGVDNPVR